MKLVLTGGFLGSGKTTAIVNACTQLRKENISVAVITNDQGDQQVDGVYISSQNIPVREVANGCFCCNYSQLDQHIQSLMTAYRPAVIFAESVGSCTDMVATITRPFLKFRPELDIVMSVFADASLLWLILEGAAHFISEEVRYIYKKQLEEADIIILNKTDLITKDQLAAIDKVIKNEYPQKTILYQNSLSEESVKQWMHILTEFKSAIPRISPEIDYDTYAAGEAALAWLDKKISIHTAQGIAPLIASRIIREIYDTIRQHQLVIGHLKFIINGDKLQQKISFTATGGDIDLLPTEVFSNDCMVLMNARVQTTPDTLKEIANNIIASAAVKYNCEIITTSSASFKPGYPTPTHRFA